MGPCNSKTAKGNVSKHQSRRSKDCSAPRRSHTSDRARPSSYGDAPRPKVRRRNNRTGDTSPQLSSTSSEDVVSQPNASVRRPEPATPHLTTKTQARESQDNPRHSRSSLRQRSIRRSAASGLDSTLPDPTTEHCVTPANDIPGAGASPTSTEDPTSMAVVGHGKKTSSKLERKNSPRLAHSTVPYPRDQRFVDRPQYQQLEDMLSHHGARVALAGLGGMGKSQLAIEYCYRLRDHFPGHWIWWIHASSAERFDKDLSLLASYLDGLSYDRSGLDTFEFVRTWLQDAKNGNWLVVLDSADDVEFLSRAPESNALIASGSNVHRVNKSRYRCLPFCNHGKVIVTSRSKAAAEELVEDCDIIEVGPMEDSLASAFFEKRLGLRAEPTLTAKLVEALERIPLAIAQAAKYIRTMAPRVTVEDYLNELSRGEESKISLLCFMPRELRRDFEAQNSILLTWQISFEHIYKTRQSAAELLSLMSFYGHQGIPDFLLRSHRQEDVQSSGSFIDDAFEHDLAFLRDWLFISVAHDTIEVSQLVQFANRAWLKQRGIHEEWLQQALKCLDRALPQRGSFENREHYQSIYPHADSILAIQATTEAASIRQASITLKLAWSHLNRGDASKAETLARQSLAIRSDLYSADDEHVLSSQYLLACVLRARGRYAEALTLQQKVWLGRRRRLGDFAVETLESRRELGALALCQGELEKAESIFTQARDASMRYEESPGRVTVACKSGLARALDLQQRHDEANLLHREVLDYRKKELPENHPATLKAYHYLAMNLAFKGRLEEAESRYKEVERLSTNILGMQHPDTIATLHERAGILSDQEDYANAEALYQRAYELRSDCLGNKHPSTISSALRLLVVMQIRNKVHVAPAMIKRLLDLADVETGKEPLPLLPSAWESASLLKAQMRTDEASHLYENVLERWSSVLGVVHPRTHCHWQQWVEFCGESNVKTQGKLLWPRPDAMSSQPKLLPPSTRLLRLLGGSV